MTSASAIDTRPRRTAGFTLVEVLIATAIVAIIAVTASSMVVTAVKREKEMELRVALRQQSVRAFTPAQGSRHVGEEGTPPTQLVTARGRAPAPPE